MELRTETHESTQEQCGSEQRDDARLSTSYRDMSELRQQMFDPSLSARTQIDAVLTGAAEQPEARLARAMAR